MPTSLKIIHNIYRDSVALMQISARIAALDGVQQASVVMATKGNLELLREAGLLDSDLEAAPSDLLVVVQCDSDLTTEYAFEETQRELSSSAKAVEQDASQPILPRTITMGLSLQPEANLALISTPGEYAAAEALKALRCGLNVMLFSDNVSISDELMLKQEAEQHGLLVMGPDCGTAIVDGIPLAFANAVRRGTIGVIGASGTGIQQVTSLIDQYGLGVSHAIGTGGRDLRPEVGGATMLRAIDKLDADPETSVVVLVSKPPGRGVADKVLARVRAADKPFVVCFLGADVETDVGSGVIAASTLEEAAVLAVAAAQGKSLEISVSDVPSVTAPRFAPGQDFVRGLYSGGTFCYEATLLLSRSLGGVRSNTPVGRAAGLEDVWRSHGHSLVDLGDDEFTRGRPHPMIDHRLRNERILQEAADPTVALILFDVVLGYGAHDDPAAEMLPVIHAAQDIAERDGRRLGFIGFICGTERDPQGLARQDAALREAGVMMASSNAQTARTAAAIMSRHG